MRELISSSGFRGIAVYEISPELCFSVGLAYGNESRGELVLGMDPRLSSPLLATSLASGISASGSDVRFLGLAPTPAVAFYSRGATGGAMVTASHNPPDYNGIKLFGGNGASVASSLYFKLVSIIESVPSKVGYSELGVIRSGSGVGKYLEYVSHSQSLSRAWRVGLDPGNGATAITAHMAYYNAGCCPSTINVMPDGRFPGRGSEPAGEALVALSRLVRSKGLDVGFAFDGDGDRFAAVDERGSPIPQDAALAFMASRITDLSVGSRAVVVNVDTSAAVDMMVEKAGGRVIRCRVGDTYVVEELLKSGGAFGGETCGAWIFPSLSLCPDGVLSSLAFLAALESSGLNASDVAKSVPQMHLVRRKTHCPNVLKAHALEAYRLQVAGDARWGSITDLDGVRAESRDKSWVLVRPSGTEPLIRVTSEAASLSAAESMADEALKVINSIIGELTRKR